MQHAQPPPGEGAVTLDNLNYVFSIAANYQGENTMFDDPSDQEDLTRLLGELFNKTVMTIPDDVDEEKANEIVAEQVVRLMDQTFKAGMIYYNSFVNDDWPPSAEHQIPISVEEATAFVTGLLGDGIRVTIKVDRGRTD